ncbi:VQ motif-containing protein 4 [Neltuma alba]|uniref:VQ motif-containing protein 4 n=1 Tax=Neltuma alba TaxID=207710 RepID=UPI0010A43726|nr:VQ motif-containing protein 4-like [Prosopis alba]
MMTFLVLWCPQRDSLKFLITPPNNSSSYLLICPCFSPVLSINITCLCHGSYFLCTFRRYHLPISGRIPSMEIMSKSVDRDHHHQSFMDSPRSNVSSTTANGAPQIPTPPLTPTTPTFPRSDSNPYPTTFVQADTSSFKQVVQMLTGSSHPPSQDPASAPPPPPPSSAAKNFNIPPVKTAPKKQGFKLYERRNSLKNSLMINTLVPNYAHSSGFSSPRKPEILSPSILDFPSLTLSPVTPLNDDPFDKSSPSLGNSSEEEKAIAEKGFYLHPSPMSTPRDSEPQLLPLFPLTSPRVSESPS